MGDALPTTALDDTYKRILDAAEILFVEHGYEGTSTRRVTQAAGVNLAAVNYHFGSKGELMQAVLLRRLALLNQRRMEALDAAEAAARAGGHPLRASQIVACFFGTLLRMGEDPRLGGPNLLRLIGRTVTEPASFIRSFLATEYSDVLERYKNALFTALPHVSKEEIAWRLHFMIGATSYAIAGHDALQLVANWETSEGEGTAAEKLLPRLMSFLLGGLRAPLPEYNSPAPSPTL